MSLKFGYMEQPNVPKALAIARKHGWTLRHHVDVVLPVAPLDQAVGAFRHAALAGPAVHRARPRRNDATDFFHIPTGRVVEVGTQVTI